MILVSLWDGLYCVYFIILRKTSYKNRNCYLLCTVRNKTWLLIIHCKHRANIYIYTHSKTSLSNHLVVMTSFCGSSLTVFPLYFNLIRQKNKMVVFIVAYILAPVIKYLNSKNFRYENVGDDSYFGCSEKNQKRKVLWPTLILWVM